MRVMRPYLRVAECLGLAAAAPDVIPLPEPGELGAVLGELVDQLREAGRLGAGGGDCAQVRRGGGGGMRPVGEQVPRGGVEERVPGGVAAGRWPVGQAVEQGQRLGVGREHVADLVEDVGGAGPQGLQELADSGPDGFGAGSGLGPGGPAGGLARPRRVAGEFVQVGAFFLVEQQRAGEGVEDGGAGVGLAALFQPDVVVDADACQRGQFLAPQARRAAQPGPGGQADIGGPDPGPPGPQELAKAAGCRHDASVPPRRRRVPGSVIARNEAVFFAARGPGRLGCMSTSDTSRQRRPAAGGRLARGAAETGFGPRFVVATSAGSVLNPVNSSIIAVALVSIGRSFGAGAAATTWLVSVLYLATAIGQPAMGRLADQLGPRRVYLAGLALVAAGGLLGWLGPVAGRAGRRPGHPRIRDVGRLPGSHGHGPPPGAAAAA